MELLVLFIIGLLIAIAVLPFVALAKANSAKRGVDDLVTRLSSLENEVRNLRPEVVPALQPEVAVAAMEAILLPVPITTAAPIGQEKVPVPPPIPERFIKEAVPQITTPARPPINWEQFMGAKLFAWIGGLALFLGVAFFVKYSFEHNLISPELRVAIGFLTGIALVIGGVALKRKENAVTAQTLCATGILILYAVTFACRSFYHFAFFGLVPTFLLMTLITATAFLLAVRLDAIVVAILGIAGGFLTPILLSTGQDNPFGLFGYIALLDIGLLMVARRKEWSVLPVLGAVGTVLMQAGWIAQFFSREHYFTGSKVLVPMAIFLGLGALFAAATVSTKRDAKLFQTVWATALGVGGFALICAFYFLSFRTLGQRPVLLFSYLFLADIVLLALIILNEKLAALSALTGLAVFTFLAIWSGQYLTNGNLYAALGAYFIFALLHTSAPLISHRVRKIKVSWWSHVFPALALILVLLPIFNLRELSLLVWPLVLCVDVLAILLAAFTGSLLSILAVLLLTLIAVGGWIFRIPSDLTGLPSSLFLLGGFAVFFLLAGAFACRRLLATNGAKLKNGKLTGDFTDPANLAIQIPALSAILPFLLLIMVTLRLRLVDPSPVFGLALLLLVLLLGMTKIL